MTHGPYIIAAFSVVGVALAWLITSSYFAMRKSEALADDLRERV